MKEVKVNATFGVNEGYFHNNNNDVKNIPFLIQDLCQEEYDKSGVAVSFIFTPSTAIYITKFGCPRGGENTFTLEAVATKYEAKDLEQWKNSTLNIIKNLKDILKQELVIIEFSTVDVEHLK